MRRFRPGVKFRSFVILRKAEAYVASMLAYFHTRTPASLALRLRPEYLLTQLLPRDEIVTHAMTLRLNASRMAAGVCERPEHAALCEQTAAYVASTRRMHTRARGGGASAGGGSGGGGSSAQLALHNTTPSRHPDDAAHPGGGASRSRATAASSLASSYTSLSPYAERVPGSISARHSTELNVTRVDREKAARQVAEADDIRQAVAILGCKRLLKRARALLADVHHVLFLESNSTFPTLHAVARSSDLSFIAPPVSSWSRFGTTFRHAATARASSEQYQTEEMRHLAHQENQCSAKLYQSLQDK